MTREEEIKSEADWYEGNYKSLQKQCFIEGAEWADKTMIAKACEWLNKTLYIHTEIDDTHCGVDTMDWVTSNYDSVSDFIDGFRKAMEGKHE